MNARRFADPSQLPPRLRFLAGGGEATRMILDKDWSAHHLGPPEGWPVALKTALSLVLNSPESMILAWGREELSFFFNETYFPLLGPRLDTAMGAPFTEVWADAWQQAKPIIDDAYAGRSRRFDDLPWKLATDRGHADTWWTFSYSRILDAEGDVDGLFILTNETTARVLADAALRESEERLRFVVEGASDYAILTTDPDGTITTWSKGAEQVMGWPATETVGKPFSCIFTPEDRAVRQDAHELAKARAEGCANDERWHLTKSGDRVFLNGSVRPLPRDADGRERGFMKIARDETQRWTAQQALRDLNASLEQQVAERTADRNLLWQLSTDLMLVAGRDGSMQAVNPAWSRVLGWTEGDLVGRPLFDFIHPDDVERTIAAATAIAAGEAFARFDNRYRHADGSYRDITWAAGPGGDKIIGVGRDTTDEKAKAAALAAAEDQLRQSQKMEAVGQLTGGVAHDFNNLLTIIRSSTDLLKRPNLNEERRTRYVSAISDTVDRAAKLTGQLLAFARRQSLEPAVFDAAKSVDSIGDMVRTLTGARIRVETIVDPTIKPPDFFVYADPNQFDTALVNMVVNARDAMDGEGRLAIRVGRADAIPAVRAHALQPGDFVTVSISDTGGGIAAENLARIFEPFFTTKGIGQGTGLGLSQVFGFAKQSGGEVAVESEIGTGTTFTLYLPRAVSDDDRPSQFARAAFLSEGHGTRILVVEDNEDVGAFATQALRELGFDTSWALDAREALRSLETEAQRFHVVFSDVVMPGMNGVELAREVRSRWPELPVVLTSGYSHILAADGSHGFELLRKPYSVADLSNMLGRVLGA